jgi:hypothetical protein
MGPDVTHGRAKFESTTKVPETPEVATANKCTFSSFKWIETCHYKDTQSSSSELI